MSLETLGNVALVVGTPLIRAGAGWAVNALKDNKVTKLEWRKLVQTIVRVGVLNVAAYYSLSFAGFDVNLVATSFGSIVADKLFDALESSKPKRA